jgi:hypothetical protein
VLYAYAATIVLLLLLFDIDRDMKVLNCSLCQIRNTYMPIFPIPADVLLHAFYAG